MRKNRIAVCVIVLALGVILSACEENKTGDATIVTENSIPVTNEVVSESDDKAEIDWGEKTTAENTMEPEEGSENNASELKVGENTPTAQAFAAGKDTQPAAQESAQLPQITTTQTNQQQIANSTEEKSTSSPGSSYEQIYNEYSQKLADYYNTAKGELQSEASSGKSIDALATSCSNKVSRLAEISTEGVNKMADLCVKRGGSASEYMNYGTKLEGVYMDYGTKLESVYMSGAMNSQTKAVEDTMKDLGISSDISGQYSEEMNKAMNQYNNELNKAMDDYNQQVQDMLKEYGF